MSDFDLIPKSFSFDDIIALQKPEIIKVKWINIDERRVISPMFVENLPVKNFSILSPSDFVERNTYADMCLLAVDKKTEVVFDSESVLLEPWFVLALPSHTSFSIANSESQFYLIELDSSSSIKDLTAKKKKDLFEMAFFIEPQFELVLLTDKVSSDGFSLVLGYPFYFNEFGPRYLCMEKFPGYAAEEYEGITRFFSFGFGYRYYFGRK